MVGTTGEETRSSRDTRFHVPTRDLAHSEGGSLSQGSQERRSPAEGGHKHGPSPEGRSPGMPRPSAAGGSRAAQFASPSGVEMQQSMPLAKRRTDYSNTQSVEEPIKPSDGQQSSDRREGKPVEVHLSSGKPAVGMYERMRGREPEGYPPRYLHRDRGREPFIEHEVSTGEEAGARSAQTWRDRWIASQSLVDELGEQLIQERMETHRLQTALKAEQGKRKAVNQSSRQSHENMALLRAEKASLEGEVIKIKNQLKMERRAWDADELQLSDKLQQMTSEVEELRHALREAERLKRKLSENLADERHLKERALSFIADRSNRMPYFDMEGPSHVCSL